MVSTISGPSKVLLADDCCVNAGCVNAGCGLLHLVQQAKGNPQGYGVQQKRTMVFLSQAVDVTILVL